MSRPNLFTCGPYGSSPKSAAMSQSASADSFTSSATRQSINTQATTPMQMHATPSTMHPKGKCGVEFLLSAHVPTPQTTPESDAVKDPNALSAGSSPLHNDPPVVPGSAGASTVYQQPLFASVASNNKTYSPADEVLMAATILMSIRNNIDMGYNRKAQTVKPKVHKSAATASRTAKPTKHTASSKGQNIAPNLNGAGRSLSKVTGHARVAKTPYEPRQRTSAPTREDKNFDEVPDYCPPAKLATGQKLKAEWRAEPIDLSQDKHRDKLIPEERELASVLRLDCATYLTTKRRIFQNCVKCVATGKVFRKTDAQQACKIDVNKASKMWVAYESVGWLKKELFLDHVDTWKRSN